MRDGVPSVDLSVASAGNVLKEIGASSKINYTLNNQSTERGFNIPHCSVAATTDPSTVRVTVEVHNWYIRYLGLYVRYLDANGKSTAGPRQHIKYTGGLAERPQRSQTPSGPTTTPYGG